MQKSSSSKYIDNFKSDIFNMQPQDTSRIGYTVHNTSLSKRTNLAPTFKQTQHDIFGSSSSSVNTTNNNKQQIKTGIRTYANSNSNNDVSMQSNNNKTQKDPTMRNVSNKSTVFAHCNDMDYKVKKSNMKTEYNPDMFFNKETPAQRHMKEFHKNFKTLKSKNQRGYYQKEENKINDLQTVQYEITPYKKKTKWLNTNSANVQYINTNNIRNHHSQEHTNTNNNDNDGTCTQTHRNLNRSVIINAPKVNRLLELRSNIFNQVNPYCDNYNYTERHTTNTDINNDNSGNSSNNNTERKIKAKHSVWPSTKMDWLTKNTEFYFKNPLYSIEGDPYNNAFTRKQMFFTESNDNTVAPRCRCRCNSTTDNNTSSTYDIDKYILNKTQLKHKLKVNDNTSNINRIKKIFHHSQSPIKPHKEMKYTQNISSVGFDNDFYLRNYHSKLNNKSHNNESINEYMLKQNAHGKEMDDLNIKKILQKEGLHVYDIKSQGDGVKFKIRENDNEHFKEKFNDVKDKLAKTEGMEIAPVKRICVNKRKNMGELNMQWKGDRVYVDQDMSVPVYKKVTHGGNNSNSSNSNSDKCKISKEFMYVDNKYKNNSLRTITTNGGKH